MAASDPSPYVATPTGTLQGVAAFSWDGSAWQPSGRAGPDVATPTGVLQGVAPFSWSGSAWTPAGVAQPGVATPTGVLDGVAVYTWSGSAWTPTGGTATPSTPSGALRGVAAFSWDGSAWQPAAQARPSVATPYGVLDGVAMFNWGGSTWQAGAAVPSGATLDISFMSGTLDPRITFTRASTASYFDSSGVIQTAASGAPRFDYDPVTHAARGLLIEEARTNLLLNSATLGTQSVAVTAQAYMLSFYGTGTITLSGAIAQTLVGAGAFPARSQLAFTPAAGTLTCTVTGSVLNAQLETGGFVTSWIPTTGAAVTRAAEACSLSDAALFLGATGKTIQVEGLAVQNMPAGQDGYWVDLRDAGGTLITQLLTPPSSAAIRTVVFQSPTTYINGADTTTGVRPTVFKAALSNGATWSSAVNGTLTPGSGGASAIGTGAYTLLRIGSGSTAVDGYIRRVRYWPRALSNAELQSVTT